MPSLAVEVSIIATRTSTLRDAVNIAHRAGLEVADVVFKPFAAAEVTLTKDEKELGCVLVDVGGGETSLSIYLNGGIRRAGAVRIGANRLTRDVAIVYRMPEAEAERIKKAYGSASMPTADSSQAPDRGIEFESKHFGSYGTRKMDQTMLSDVLEPRAREIIEYVGSEIASAGGTDALGAGIILTGGGARLRGFPQLVARLLDLPVRVGTPAAVPSRFHEPQFATLLGLVACGERMSRTRPSSWVSRVRSGLGI